MELVRNRLARLPDIEKLLAKIFTYSIKQRVKAIYFEDVSLLKMKEFRMLLKTLRQLEEILSPLIKRKDEFKSVRLRTLLTFEDDATSQLGAAGMFPKSLEEEIDQFDKLIIWKKVEGTDTEIPEPQ